MQLNKIICPINFPAYTFFYLEFNSFNSFWGIFMAYSGWVIRNAVELIWRLVFLQQQLVPSSFHNFPLIHRKNWTEIMQSRLICTNEYCIEINERFPDLKNASNHLMLIFCQVKGWAYNSCTWFLRMFHHLLKIFPSIFF